MNGLYVVDSSVFNKLYLNEEDREQALALFEQAAEDQVMLIAPTLLYYEVMATAQYYHLPLFAVLELLEEQIATNLLLVEPNSTHHRKAIDIIQQGHPKSGYPSIYDAIFHALAIIEGGTLITADHRHFSKSKQFGHILMLKNFL